MIKISDDDVYEYHEKPRPGKLEVVTSKPCLTQRDLSMAYTPGVARPCLEIERDPELAYRYTGKGNLVAVVSNGTAVLGLGDIGALGGKPVMEGKGVLFKRFADVDVFDIEVNTHDPDEIIKLVKLIEPTFGGINLEDIKAPECFYIEEELKKIMDIPVFHDDQHGTAIISGAALVNALELVNKKIDEVRVVFAGAGAAGIACADMYLNLGVKRENIHFVDTVGVIWKGRTEKMNPYKERYAVETKERTLADALKGADVFVGVSGQGPRHAGHAEDDGGEPDRVRDGEPGPGDPLPAGRGDAQGRHHGDGALRLPEPGEQRPRLPVHLPRRAGRPVSGHQQRDEDGRGARPGGAGQGGRARGRAEGVRRQQHVVRPRVPHPEAVRPARPHVGSAGGGQGRVRHGRGEEADHGLERVPRAARADARPVAQGDALRHAQGAERRSRSASCSPRASTTRSSARRGPSSIRRSRCPSCSATRR